MTSSTVGRASAADEEQDVEGLARQAGEPAAKQLPQALRHAQGAAGRRSRVRSNELTAELERKKRVACRRLLHTNELRTCQVERESLLKQAVHHSQAERAKREPLEPLFGEGAVEIE